MASRRGYLTQAELAQYADITIIDPTEADDQISMAEELIDEYAGFQQKFMQLRVDGLVTVGGSTTFTLRSTQQNTMNIDFLKGCWIEVIGGTGSGQLRKITGQTLPGLVTVETAFSPALDTTSYYKIWQLGKFPRHCDVVYNSDTTNTYYKSIPEKVRRAVAAQVEYMINMGSAFFASDKLDLKREKIGDYEYEKDMGTSGTADLIAPKAKMLLKGIRNITGRIIA